MKTVCGAILMIVILLAMVSHSCDKAGRAGKPPVPPTGQNIDAE